MICSKKNRLIPIFLFALGSLLALQGHPSDAQMLSGYAPGLIMDPQRMPMPGLREPGRYLQGAVPGLADRTCGFFFLPPFQAEFRVRFLYQFMSGELERISTGEGIELADELGLEHTTVIVQPMARAQFGRLSFRLYGDMYAREIRAPGGSEIDWPVIWFGSDFDVIERESWRAGLTFDITPIYPEFTIGPNPLGAFRFKARRPATLGIFFAYNPPDLGGMTPSIEVRARRGVRTGTRLDEAEVSLGIRTPESVLGSIAVRGGWRYTAITCHSEGDHVIYPNFSAYFFDLVHYY